MQSAADSPGLIFLRAPGVEPVFHFSVYFMGVSRSLDIFIPGRGAHGWGITADGSFAQFGMKGRSS